jgi:hypothetical protein
MPDGHGYANCFGPYLRYAISTDFRTFEFFDEAKFTLFLLVEFKRAEWAVTFGEKMRHARLPVDFGSAADSTRYAAVLTHKSSVVDPNAIPIWEHYVARVELSLPLKSSAFRPSDTRRKPDERWKDSQHPSGQLLIGVIDDGCPFAAAHFLARRSPAAPRSTRVRAIWDQDQNKEPVNVTVGGAERTFGQLPGDFLYGIEYLRDFKTPGAQIGLDEWINLHLTPAGSIDEDGCYADARFTNLARGRSHGGHVMDVFAGRIPTSSRVGPSPPGDRRDPPNWKVGAGPASSADTDVVFVQFPENCIRDATGVWLKAYVFAGIHYILSFAHPETTRHVVINVSYGPTTGPHDGTAELETALTALVAEYNGTPGKPKLEIVLPAGNAYLSEGHVAFRNSTTHPANTEWVWRLPPDNTVLCFAEVWTKTANAGDITVTLRSPGGITFCSTTGPTPPPSGVPLPPYTGVYAPLKWGSHTMWLLSIAPTIASSGVAAEHGDWTVTVDDVGMNTEVHAYVARTDPNMGVRTGARRSYFVDPNWEQTRSAAASCAYANGEFDETESLVHRFGTLNGIASGKDASVHVAGGYILANGRKSPYPSAGPARGYPLAPRVGPDYALPCDETYALEGIRAGGNRSGSVFRLTGTSAAAPQLARWVANPRIPRPNNIPKTEEEKYKRGRGNLKPP